MRKESELQTRLNKWIQKNPDRKVILKTAVFELKFCRGASFSVNRWGQAQGHQLRGLLQASSKKGLAFKLSDADPRQKPFDSFYIANADAYLALFFVRTGDMHFLTAETALSLYKKDVMTIKPEEASTLSEFSLSIDGDEL